VVEARKDTTVVLHPLADDRRVLPIERTGEQLQAAPGFMLVLSLQPRLPEPAEGPQAQHAAALRGADAGLPGARARSAHRAPEGGVEADPRSSSCKLAQALRRLTEHDLEETASTRLLVMAARLVRQGLPSAGSLQAAVVDALTDDADTARRAGRVVRRAVLGDDRLSARPTMPRRSNAAGAQRRAVTQIGFFALFLLAPALNLLRFDLHRGAAVGAGPALVAGHRRLPARPGSRPPQAALSILLRGFVPAVLLAAGFLFVAWRYGRLYCGWLCPHFSWSSLLNGLLHRASGKLSLWDRTPRRAPAAPPRNAGGRLRAGVRQLRLPVGDHAADLPAAAGQIWGGLLTAR
jgi:hypothetical protein